MSSNSTSRIRCLINYNDVPLSVEDVIKLGDFYKVFRAAEINSQPVSDQLKHKHGQQLVWFHLPLEVRMMIYEYVYAYAYEISAEQASGWTPIMQVQSVRRWQLRHPSDVATTSFNPDDLYVLLHHSLADLLVSRQWLEETAGVMATTHRRTVSCELVRWNHFLLTFTQPWTGAEALDKLGHLVASVMLSQSYCLDLKMDHGDSFLPVDMERISTCKQFDEVRVTYLGWSDRLYWIKSEGADGPLSLLAPDADQSSSTLIRDQAYKVSRSMARMIRKQFYGCIKYDTGQLPAIMRTSFFDWSAGTLPFLTSKALFHQWKKIDSRLKPFLLLKSLCLIHRYPDRALHINFRLEDRGRLQVYAYRGKNTIHLEGNSEQWVDENTHAANPATEQSMVQTG